MEWRDDGVFFDAICDYTLMHFSGVEWVEWDISLRGFFVCTDVNRT